MIVPLKLYKNLENIIKYFKLKIKIKTSTYHRGVKVCLR